MSNEWVEQYQSLAAANEAAMASLEKERAKISEITRQMKENVTTVRAKDRSFVATFDGRGELTSINFKGNKFRTMAPAELSHLLVETIRQGRGMCLQKLSDVAGEDLLPGASFAELMSGDLSVEEVFEKVISPFMNDVDFEGILGRSDGKQVEGKQNG